MKEFTYTYIHGNYYLDSLKSAGAFHGESQVKLIIKPHEFEMKISDEVLRKSCCAGFTALITSKGAVTFFDNEGTPLASSEETDKEFREFSLNWKQGVLTLRFGHKETVDNYPNCDGEYDRWDVFWIAEHEVKFSTETNKFI